MPGLGQKYALQDNKRTDRTTRGDIGQTLATIGHIGQFKDDKEI